MPQREGIFQRFTSDSRPMNIEPDMRVKTRELITALEANPDHTAVFRELIRPGMEVAAEDTWFQAARELFNAYERYDSHPLPNATKTALIELMKILCREDGSVNWDEARTYIIDHLTELCPTYPGRFESSIGHEIQRREDGSYFFIDEEGGEVEMRGLRTAREEEIAFYSGDVNNMYGRLYHIVRYVALFDIADEFARNTQDFPERLCCQLFDNGFSDSGYLKWKWSMPVPFDYVPMQWHPRSPYSNPEWLASDLIMQLPQIHETPAVQVNLSPSESEFQTWRDAFAGYTRQLEIPIQSNVLIGDGQESYFDFMGRKVRWVNGNAFSQPIIVVPSNEEDCADAIVIARRFMSLLNVNNDVPLSERLISIQLPRYLPVFGSRRMPVFRGISEEYALPFDDFEQYSVQRWAALAFNREASSANSILYEFLNYFKIIELGHTENQTKNWIRDNLSDAATEHDEEWLGALRDAGQDPAQYINRRGRAAIAHANYNLGSEERLIHNPDNPEDYRITQRLLPVVKTLAKKRLEEIE